MSRSELVMAVRNGATYTDVALASGVSVATAWRWCNQDLGSEVSRRGRLDHIRKSMMRTAIARCDQSLRAIAREFQVDDRTVRRIRAEMSPQEYRPFAVQAVVAGATYTTVASKVGTSIYTVWKWVQTDLKQPPVRNLRLSAETKKKIQTEIDSRQRSLRSIAASYGVHISTVCELRDAMVIGGHRAKPVRCPTCRALINTQECLRCAAIAYSSQRSLSSF